MTTNFLDSFLVAGIGEELVPDGVKKNLLCGIKDIVLVQGSIPSLKEILINSEHADSKLKWIRFMTLSNSLDLHLAIHYANPFKSDESKALYDIELVRCHRETPVQEVKPIKGVLVQTCLTNDIKSVEDIFE